MEECVSTAYVVDLVKVLGGEPFVRKDIVHILKGSVILLTRIFSTTTNGMLTKPLIQAIKAVAWPDYSFVFQWMVCLARN